MKCVGVETETEGKTEAETEQNTVLDWFRELDQTQFCSKTEVHTLFTPEDTDTCVKKTDSDSLWQ